MNKRNNRIIELIGKSWLASELAQAGFHIATPSWDEGIDLIAYHDGTLRPRSFIGIPIQVKAASNHVFSLHEKYKKYPGLVLVYVWNVSDPRQRTAYALTYGEAYTIARKMGWTKSSSWINKHSYGNTQPGERLCARLKPYRMTTRSSWKRKLFTSCRLYSRH